MANFDVIKPSYDALNSLEQSVRSLVYVTSIIPDDEEHAALFSLLADKLERDLDLLKSEVYRLWPDEPKALRSIE